VGCLSHAPVGCSSHVLKTAWGISTIRPDPRHPKKDAQPRRRPRPPPRRLPHLPCRRLLSREAASVHPAVHHVGPAPRAPRRRDGYLEVRLRLRLPGQGLRPVRPAPARRVLRVRPQEKGGSRKIPEDPQAEARGGQGRLPRLPGGLHALRGAVPQAQAGEGGGQGAPLWLAVLRLLDLRARRQDVPGHPQARLPADCQLSDGHHGLHPALRDTRAQQHAGRQEQRQAGLHDTRLGGRGAQAQGRGRLAPPVALRRRPAQARVPAVVLQEARGGEGSGAERGRFE